MTRNPDCPDESDTSIPLNVKYFVSAVLWGTAIAAIVCAVLFYTPELVGGAIVFVVGAVGVVVYTSLVREAAGRLVDVACWAHGRRGFEEAIPTTSHPLVHEAMIWTQQLYDIEDRAKEMSPEDRRALRQDR